MKFIYVIECLANLKLTKTINTISQNNRLHIKCSSLSNKFYIGKTTSLEYRIEEHFDGKGSQWTKLHLPIRVVEIIPDCTRFDEDYYTLKYMDKYGIDNVRGGSFCEINLNNKTKKILKKMLNTANDRCYICGQKGHLARNCGN